ncbi:hypothetical protein NDU88_006171 [Pleurodeles waltl]|uniref:Uncharacterized protein n=1 Tax=Pleurodeles waltl TaxID=8319 RepID=A0AAV7WZV5_PLEWA|nr:hypothetical protein NDU88_006171 [Pleurodeles waltl]
MSGKCAYAPEDIWLPPCSDGIQTLRSWRELPDNQRCCHACLSTGGDWLELSSCAMRHPLCYVTDQGLFMRRFLIYVILWFTPRDDHHSHSPEKLWGRRVLLK